MMWSNTLEYSTDAGLYYMRHAVKVPFCMPELSRSKIIDHLFHVKNNEGESGIGYDKIIGCDLMVQLGPSANFKREVLQLDGATVPMK